MQITKVCNIFSENAETEKMELQFGLFKKDINSTINKLEEKQGGLWVGGTFTIDEEEFRFTTNTVNEIVHKSDENYSLPLSSIKRVWREFGWFTGILNFELDDRVVKVRCFGAKTVAERINNEFLRIN